jgi:hypothetical protein
MAPTRNDRIAAEASAWKVEAKTFEMDELRSSASALPALSLCRGQADASASSARAPGVRPERA